MEAPRQLVVPISNTPMNPENHTLYIQNLPEKMRIRDTKKMLEELFSPFGPIHGITVKKNIHLRGQAFIVYQNLEDAKKALQEMQSFPIYFKPMFINYSKFKSHVIAKQDGTFDEEKMKQYNYKMEKAKRPRVTRKQALQHLLSSGAPMPQVVPHIPSGELPNKVLFLQDLPEDTTEIRIKELFQPFAGFKEVRLVPMKSDIAFVEFENELQSTIAKNSLDRFAIAPGKYLRVTYARK